MMDPMVSARVPYELRQQVHEQLKELGSTPTELINSAYRYVRERNELPKVPDEIEPGIRRLDESRLAELVRSIGETTWKVDEDFFDGRDYEDVLESELRESYEALA